MTRFMNWFNGGRRVALGLALVVVLLALPLAVFADNVQNDITVGGNDTFVLGSSTTVSYRIAANSGDGQTGCNAADGSPAVVTINTPLGVTATPNPLTFTACSTFQPTTFTASAAGNYPITVSVSDSGTGTYNTNPAAFTLKVTAPADTSAPVITPNVSGTLGDNGWYVSDVTVSWTVVDNESTISSSSGCDPTTIDYDTAGTTLTCEATSAGGTSSESVTIKRDATPPTDISFVGGPSAGASYYYGFVPAAPTCTADGAISGLASCTVSGYSNAVGAHSLSATATDNAGNSASASLSYTVLNWTLSGFYNPVDMSSGILNAVKGGSTVPLKFRVFAGSTEITDVAMLSMSLRQVACPGGTEDPMEVDLLTSGSTSLRYDTTEGQFIQNWKTPKLPGKCYEVKMLAADGSSLVAYFKLK